MGCKMVRCLTMILNLQTFCHGKVSKKGVNASRQGKNDTSSSILRQSASARPALGTSYRLLIFARARSDMQCEDPLACSREEVEWEEPNPGGVAERRRRHRGRVCADL